MLEIKNLSLIKSNNKKEIQILNGLFLNIPKNRVTLFLGKSGSGKTTLLRCIAQLETQYTGEISYHEKSIKRLSPKERCQMIGFIPQTFSLFPHMNVLDNCASALRALFGMKKNAAYQRVKEVLCLLDIEKLALSLPRHLSGGQQQRAAIARALVLNPSFLLLDEPTSALDPENAGLFIKVVQNLLKAGKGIVISSQDMSLVSKLLDLVYFIENGVFIESYDKGCGMDSLCSNSRIFQFLNQ